MGFLMATFLAAIVVKGQPVAPTLRLPGTVQPLKYAAELKLIPGQDRFTGAIDIDLNVHQSTSVIWIHAKSLDVQNVSIQTHGKDFPTLAGPRDNDLVALQTQGAIPAGPTRLHISYSGQVSRILTDGLFQQRYDGEWYIFSKFEPITARRAFPCFDEPSFKTPWKLTLHIPNRLHAFSNTPAVSETEESGELKTVLFAESKPLPSYLVALAVGPFDIVDAGKAGANGTPLRIIVPRGRANDAVNAAGTTPKLLSLLENYFGIPFPYEKLDQIVVPTTTAWGAMENAGLIAYSQVLLSAPQDDTELRQRARASVMAHEISHQWFGDLVTTAWWDDIWLNEAFASWISRKIINEWRPDWNGKSDAVISQSVAMNSDRLLAARKIRQPIEAPDDIANAFDNITYSKGAAVITMFENYAGPDLFRKGVQQFLKSHAWKNADAADFLSALDLASGRGLSSSFSTFLNQRGVPLLHVNVSCHPDSAPVVRLSQERFLPLGSSGSTAATWKIPVCMKWTNEGTPQQECVLLSKQTDDFPLPETKSCPGWLLANANGTGYYRTKYEGGLLDRLFDPGFPELREQEKVSVLQDVQAFFAAGRLDAGQSLQTAVRFGSDPSRDVVQATFGFFGTASEAVPVQLRPNLARLIQSVYSPRAHRLGWIPKIGESRDARLLRPSLLSLVALTGDDRELRAEGARLGRTWLDDRHAVNLDLAGTALIAATWDGDGALLQRIVAEIKTTKSQRERSTMVTALRYFGDPAIARSVLDLIFASGLEPRELTSLLTPARRETRPVIWDFVKQNFERLNARLPGARGIPFAAVLPLTAAGFCNEQRRVEVQSFFEDKIGMLKGGARNLASALENIRLCEAATAAIQPSIITYLQSH